MSTFTYYRPKVNWAEIDNDFAGPVVSQKTVPPSDPNEIVLESEVVETTDPSGKPVKYLRKVVQKIVRENVHPLVEKRRNWDRFKGEDNTSSILDTGDANSGEEMFLKLSFKSCEDDDLKDLETAKKKPASQLPKTLYTKAYKGVISTPANLDLGAATSQSNADPTASAGNIRNLSSLSFLKLILFHFISAGKIGPSKYVPPHARRDASGVSHDIYSLRERRDDVNTLRITNLSPDTTEADLKDLTQRFGPTARVFIARDREANVCKGFAFVSYQHREHAEYALNRLNGHGYDNLILHVEWAK